MYPPYTLQFAWSFDKVCLAPETLLYNFPMVVNMHSWVNHTHQREPTSSVSRCSCWGKQQHRVVHPNPSVAVCSLVGGAITILKNMKVNGKDYIPYIMENKTCTNQMVDKSDVWRLINLIMSRNSQNCHSLATLKHISSTFCGDDLYNWPHLSHCEMTKKIGAKWRYLARWMLQAEVPIAQQTAAKLLWPNWSSAKNGRGVL